MINRSKKGREQALKSPCPCHSGLRYALCCAPFHRGEHYPDHPEVLMRSRYSAFYYNEIDYLKKSWHSTTQPKDLKEQEGAQWIALKIIDHEIIDINEAYVTFEARYREENRVYKMCEKSRFTQEAGRWVYLDGEVEYV